MQNSPEISLIFCAVLVIVYTIFCLFQQEYKRRWLQKFLGLTSFFRDWRLIWLINISYAAILLNFLKYLDSFNGKANVLGFYLNRQQIMMLASVESLIFLLLMPSTFYKSSELKGKEK